MSRGEKILKTIVYACWIFALVVLLLFVALLVGCKISNARRQNPPEDIYADYQVYDYHLSVSEDAIGKEYGRYIRKVYQEEGDFYIEYEVTYRLIDGMDDSAFVCSDIRWNTALSPHGTPYVAQNPTTNGGDILSSWTPSKILVRYRIGDSERTVALRGGAVYEELLTLREGKTYTRSEIDSISDTVKQEMASVSLSAAAREKLAPYFADSPYLSIRIHFEESNVILWESAIYYKNGLMCVNVGKELVNFEERPRYALVEEDSALCRAIIAALEACTAE